MKAKAELGLVSAIIVAGFAALVFNRQVKIVREVHAEETEACRNRHCSAAMPLRDRDS